MSALGLGCVKTHGCSIGRRTYLSKASLDAQLASDLDLGIKLKKAVSVSLRGKRRFSDADVERARLLPQYALHRARVDAQRLADLGRL